MNVSKEEILKYASAINIEVNDEEIKNIENSIQDLTSRLDKLLAEDTGEFDRKMLGADLKNQFDSNSDNEVENDDHMKNLNNYDGQYIGVEKVIIDE